MLIDRFRTFLENLFPKERIKERRYVPLTEDASHHQNIYKMRLAKHTAYQLYVNSRPLVREYRKLRYSAKMIVSMEFIPAYFAGRFDGDGSVAHDHRSDLRITYGHREEAENDQALLLRIGFFGKVYQYKKAKTFVLYVGRDQAERFLTTLAPHSSKIDTLFASPVETSSKE